MWHKTKVNVDDQNGKHHSIVWSIWKVREFPISYDFLKNGIIKIIKLIVNLIMCRFLGKPNILFNLSLFASDPILVKDFAYNMVQYVMAGCQNERRKNDSQISEKGER